MVVWHNNGDPNIKGVDCGYTEYTTEEIDHLYNGSVDNLIKEYAANGITIFRIDFIHNI